MAYDSQKSSDAKALHAKANCRNLFIKIPGTPEGLPAIEETIASGVPVNVTLLFSREQYEAAAEAYLKGLERRLSAELSLDVHSVASLFVSRWDKATMDKVGLLHNQIAQSVRANDECLNRLEGLGVHERRAGGELCQFAIVSARA